MLLNVIVLLTSYNCTKRSWPENDYNLSKIRKLQDDVKKPIDIKSFSLFDSSDSDESSEVKMTKSDDPQVINEELDKSECVSPILNSEKELNKCVEIIQNQTELNVTENNKVMDNVLLKKDDDIKDNDNVDQAQNNNTLFCEIVNLDNKDTNKTEVVKFKGMEKKLETELKPYFKMSKKTNLILNECILCYDTS